MENIAEVTEESCNKAQSNNGHEIPHDATEGVTEERTINDNTEQQRLGSSSISVGNTETEAAEEIALHSAAMKNLETESTSDNLIDQALQQEDEFLNYLMSLPAASAPSSLAETHVYHPTTQHAPLLTRSFSTYGDAGASGSGAGSNISGVAKVGLDHLDNLCKLMEQLGDLREQNSKLQRRVKYLEDLKKLQEMHKQLQEEETRRCETQKTCSFVQSQHNQYQRNLLIKSRQQCRREIEKNFPSPSTRTTENVDALNERPVLAMADNSNWRSSKCKSLTNSKFNQSSSRYQQRERSKSVGVEELKLDQDQQSDEGKTFSSVMTHKEGRTKQVQRRSLTNAVATANKKAKVSKWTKVKEAFKWEKASVVMVSGTNNSQECDINGNCHHMCSKSENMQLLNAPNSFSAASPVGSVISGHSSYSSGGYSPNVTRFHSLKRNYSQDKADFIGSTTMASTCFLSSSSSSEDLDIEQDSLNFTRPQRSASATDSTHECMVQHINTRRCSLVHGYQEDETSRRSKSLDGENRFPNKNTSSDSKAQHPPQQQQGQQQHQKAHKTPWGKVKDIIQTRKDSLKKRHQTMKSETYKCDEDQEEKAEQSSMMKTSGTTAPSMEQVPDETAAKETGRRARLSLDNTPQQEITKDPPTGRRLTPMLTLTLPSTEELRNLSGTPSPAKFSPTESTSSGVLSGSPNSPQTEERHHKISVSSNDGSGMDKDLKSKSAVNSTKSQIVPRAAPGSGMSPTSHRRASKWTKVKKAFLTGRRDEDGGEGRISSSVPSSPNRNSSFFEEMDTEEVNSGELEEQGVQKMKQEDSTIPTDVTAEGESHEISDRSDIHAEIQRNYEELQMKLTQEFHKKLTEWEMVRSGAASSSASVITYMPTCRGQNLNPASTSLASDAFQRSIDRTEATRSQRDTVGLKVFDEDNLSPHFRKKLQEWQRMKKAPPTAITAGNLKDDSYAVTPQFRKKIAEWQLWKSGTGKAANSEQEPSSVPPEEFRGKLQQWENMKSSSSGPTASSSTNTDSLPSIKGDINEAISADESNSSNAKTSSPKINQKEGLQYVKIENKMCQSVTNKNGECMSGDDGGGSEVVTMEVKNYHKGKSQKYKELHWLEKELQKIEREKQRLEREREKYLEREARLEKMRLAVGAGRQKQEVLIQTSTGFFRFQGISEKFTRRLYEWEKARGIGPEASTFALLDPGYRPPLTDSSLKQYGKGYGGEKGGEGSTLARSKSASSVSNLGNTDIMSMTGGNAVAAIITHQSSSLSLNDVEVLEKVDLTSALEDSRAASEPHICISEDNVQDDEPAAMIVDVEDVVVETAAPLPASPIVSSQTPIYSYAPEEVSQLIDSSGSDGEYNDSRLAWKDDSKKEYNYNLLEENINLLQKLKMKEDICKKLENEIEGLEGKIEDVAKIHELELQHLEEEEKHLCSQHEAKGEREHEELVEELRVHIRNLEHRQECLRQEEEQLQDSFIHHSEQQATLAHSLVNKVKQLQEANMKATSEQTENTEDWNHCMRKQASTVNLVQQLSTQLIQMAEKLEIVLAQRNTEIQNLKLQLRDQGCHSQQDKSRYRQHWSSEEEISTSMNLQSRSQADNVETQGSKLPLPRQSSDELIELPSLLTTKVLELKELLNMLCVPQDTNLQQIQDHLNDSQAEDSVKKNTTNNVSLHVKETSCSEGHAHPVPKIKAAACYDSLDFQETTKCEKVPDNWHERKQRRQHTISHLNSTETTDSENHNEDHNDNHFKLHYEPETQNEETEDKQLPGAVKQQKGNGVTFSFSKSQTPSLENTEIHNLVNSSIKKAEVETVSRCHERALFNSVNQEDIQRKESEANIENDSKSNSNTKEFIIDESDVEEESTDESDKTEEEEDEEDEEEEDEDEHDECYDDDDIASKAEATNYDEAKNIRRSQLTNIKACIHATENKSECVNITKTQFLSDLQKDRRKDYETEVHSANRNERKCLNERHKSLKTRRISDTHIGYKHQKYDQYDKSKYSMEGNNGIAQLGSDDENNQTEDSKISNNQSYLASTSCTAVNVAGAAKKKISDSNIQKSVVKSSVQVLDDAVEVTLPLSSTLRKNQLCVKENRAATNTAKDSSPEMLSSSTVRDNSQLKESMLVTPDNVFVKTTRKIFSPVRRDSKGKPSSVISYTVGESPPRTRALEDFVPSNNSSSSTKEAAKLSSSCGSSNLFAANDKKETINNENAGTITPPSWVIMRNSRSQSSSPALMRRKIMPTTSAKNFTDEQCAGTVHGDQVDITKLARQKYVDGSSRSSQERKISSKVGSYEETSNSSVTPPPSFPPIPQSPGPTRRDLLKVVNKETAPSIRMMIAKYNQKLTDGRYGNGGRGPSPEVNAGASSGSASPVAWRSPVAERRVLAQMERYQEEVRRVLTKGSNKLSEKNENNRVKKSASAGLISVSQDNLSKPSTESKTSSGTNKPSNADTNLSSAVDHQHKGILKSSSAGAIKPEFSPFTTSELKSRGQTANSHNNNNKDTEAPLLDHTSANLKEEPPAKKKPPVYNTSLSLDVKYNTEGKKNNESNIFCHNDLPIQPRALKLQRAKQEFLTRGPSEASKLWSNDNENPSIHSAIPPENTSKDVKGTILQDKTEKHHINNKTYNRLSQISVGSDILVPGGSEHSGKNLHSTDEGLLLVKSASAGMINIDQGTYNHMCGIVTDSHSSGTSDGPETKTKISQGSTSKFGISSITSKFRKVKMRKSKENTGSATATNKMNTVTTLCRQSLLVDLHLSKGNNESITKETDISKPSTSKSCPSSPVLQRPPCGGDTATENRRVNNASTSWICNPARKIFKPK